MISKRIACQGNGWYNYEDGLVCYPMLQPTQPIDKMDQTAHQQNLAWMQNQFQMHEQDWQQQAQQQQEAQQQYDQQQQAQYMYPQAHYQQTPYQQDQPPQNHPAQRAPVPPQRTTPQLPFMTAGDLRQQTLSNALVLYPNVVDQHARTYPNVPVRAEDIFDICVSSIDRQIPNGPVARYWTAKLTHAPGTAGVNRAGRAFLIAGRESPAVDWALCELFDAVTFLLSDGHDVLLPSREGSRLITRGEFQGTIVHYNTIEDALAFAKKAKKAEDESDAERASAAQPAKTESGV
jgi:hypothetical protein